jgi:hypothetical protein
VSDDRVDLANRFIVVTAAMLIAFAALLIVLLAWGATSATIDRIEDFAGYLRDHDTTEAKAIVTLGALVVVLLMATAIIVELTPPATQRMRLRTVTSGNAAITTKEIAERIEAEVRESDAVDQVRAMITPRGPKIEVLLDLHVARDANLAEAADNACRRAQQLVESQLGIPLAQAPRARLHYRELQLREGAPVPDDMRRPASPGDGTGWERPAAASEGERE